MPPVRLIVPYQPIGQSEIALPEHIYNEHDERQTLPDELYVPSRD